LNVLLNDPKFRPADCDRAEQNKTAKKSPRSRPQNFGGAAEAQSEKAHDQMTARRRPEQQIQAAVFEHLALRGAPGTFAFHCPNGGWRSKIEAKILQHIGVKAGVPDVIAVKDGKTFALELKSDSGRLSEAQRRAHEALRRAGASVAVAFGLDEALAQLEQWNLIS
jgi:hypothetical protein